MAIQRHTLSFVCYLSLLCISVFTCTLPTDPAKDPDKLKATISLSGSSSFVTIGEEAVFRIAINYPVHADSIRISFGEYGITDTVLFCTKHASEPETLVVKCNYKNAVIGTKTLTATVKLSNGSYKSFFKTIETIPGQVSVKFTSTPNSHLIPVGYPDTLIFVAKVDSSRSGIVFNSFTNPLLEKEFFEIRPNIDTVRIIIIPVRDTTYTVTCTAQFGSTFDTAHVVLNAFKKPVLLNSSGVGQSSVGESDTLSQSQWWFRISCYRCNSV